uniref:Threonine synthase-like 2 n=1 Tax=Poecilia reticulata TaxID=8081 RepID=A0A3P9NLX7_POERE
MIHLVQQRTSTMCLNLGSQNLTILTPLLPPGWSFSQVLRRRSVKEWTADGLRMRYCSTRGGVQNRDFREVLFSGFAPDGGMFMPETLPAVSPETLRSWTGLRYQRLVLEVAALFIPEELIPRGDLEALVAEALSGFSVPDSVRIARLKDGLSVLELFHGETLAFKDLAMSCTVHFLNYFLRRDGSRAVVLVGTSGDTGGSAVRSARSLPGLDVLVVFPRGRITAVQEKHMTSCLEDNVHVFAGPVQHGAGLLAAAGPGRRRRENHDGGVPAFASPAAAREPAQTAGRGSGDRRCERPGDPGDHEAVLGAEPVPAVSAHGRGRLAPLQQNPQPGQKQMLRRYGVSSEVSGGGGEGRSDL